MDGLSSGKHTLKLFGFESLILEKEISLKSEMNHVDLEVELDFNRLVENAGLHMNDSNLENQHFVSPFYDPDAYYQGIKVGSYFGEKKGRMRMLTGEGHVSCNKSDHDKGANFPFNGADCTKAVAGGVLYLSDTFFFGKYQQGVYCVQEAMSSGEDENESNSYCNHLPKSGGYYTGYKNLGYNCSSFTFLNGDERLNKYN